MAGRSVSSPPHARHVLPSPLIPARALAQTCAGDHPQQAHARHDRCGAHACGLHHVLRLDSAAQGVRALVPSRIQPPSARATLRSRLPTRWPSAESMVPIHAHVGTLTPAATALCAGPWGARASGGAPTFTPRTFTPHGTRCAPARGAHGRAAELPRSHHVRSHHMARTGEGWSSSGGARAAELVPCECSAPEGSKGARCGIHQPWSDGPAYDCIPYCFT